MPRCAPRPDFLYFFVVFAHSGTILPLLCRYNGGFRQSRETRSSLFHNQYIKVGFTLSRVGRVFFCTISTRILLGAGNHKAHNDTAHASRRQNNDTHHSGVNKEDTRHGNHHRHQRQRPHSLRKGHTLTALILADIDSKRRSQQPRLHSARGFIEEPRSQQKQRGCRQTRHKDPHCTQCHTQAAKCNKHPAHNTAIAVGGRGILMVGHTIRNFCAGKGTFLRGIKQIVDGLAKSHKSF